MLVPKTGDPAPDFSVTLADGSQARRADFAQRPLLLVFLRHLA